MSTPDSGITFTFRHRFPLLHCGEAALLGRDAGGLLYTEEYIGDEGLLARACWTPDGTLFGKFDESDPDTDAQPVIMPESLAAPSRGWNTTKLNFAGARLRGLRETDRIAETTLPLGAADKMLLAGILPGVTSPMHLIGVAESYVISEAALTRTLYLVCRRLRIAVALPSARHDPDGMPYDYEAVALHVVHLADMRDDRPIPAVDWFSLLPEPAPRRPTDCLLSRRRRELVVLESGCDDQPAQLYLYQVDDLPPLASQEESLFDRLYR
jgi:hypothetical protein